MDLVTLMAEVVLKGENEALAKRGGVIKFEINNGQVVGTQNTVSSKTLFVLSS